LELLKRNVLPAGSSNVLVKSDVVQRLGGFDEQLAHLADWDLWVRLAGEWRPTVCRDVLVACVAHRDNMLLNDRGNVMDELEYFAAKHREARLARGVELDRAAFSRFVAYGHRRAGRRVQAAHAYLNSALRHRSVGDLPRALGALAGERGMGLGRRLAGIDRGTEPSWLGLYRSRI